MLYINIHNTLFLLIIPQGCLCYVEHKDILITFWPSSGSGSSKIFKLGNQSLWLSWAPLFTRPLTIVFVISTHVLKFVTPTLYYNGTVERPLYSGFVGPHPVLVLVLVPMLFYVGPRENKKVWLPDQQWLIILLLETPCSSVRIPQFLPHLTRTLTPSLRGSHGLSARRARRTKSSPPEGQPNISWGPESPPNF